MTENKFCKNCEYGDLHPKTEYTPARYICNRPNPSLVTGEQIGGSECWDERKYRLPEIEHLYCGLSGKFYKEKERVTHAP